ncbi:MAG: hypothetical protein DRJ44_00095 [Thermoprotei archaeon]|nr:MAG: hypothetical protein DRJ44_00095 [Thermoprotei archaeon]
MIMFIYTICAALVNFAISMIFLSSAPLSNSFSTFLWILQFSLVNYGISSIIFSLKSFYIKKEEYKHEITFKEILFKTISNIHNLALISFIGYILAYTLLFSPTYFVAIASFTISGYGGFDTINEAFKQLFRRRKFFVYTIPYITAGLLTVAISVFSLGYIPETDILSYPLILSIAIAVQWILHSIALRKTVEEYISWGLKICVFCGSQVPIEARYCGNCGNRLKS